MDIISQKIARKTGKKPSSCSCKDCASMCVTACLGTPQDILRLVESGYTHRIKLTYWMVGMVLGELDFPIEMYQLEETKDKGCSMLVNDKCTLHDAGLKPTEGYLSSSHEPAISFEKSLFWNVAKEWIEPKNKFIISQIKKAVDDFSPF